jgi:hypothetical protein
MNEYIEVAFRKSNGQRLRVKRQRPGGIEFDEGDPIERTIGLQITPRNDVTRIRMQHIAQIKGWDLGQFKLNASVEDGNIIFRGVDADALPEGYYALRVRVEEVRTTQPTTSVDVEHDGHGTLRVDVKADDRKVDVDLSGADAGITRVLEASTVDGFPAEDWLAAPDWRPTRKACLLNVLATLRVTPTKADNLLARVQQIVSVMNDRVYMNVDSTLKTKLDALVADPTRPFYAEGPPTAPIHQRLLDVIPPSEKAGFGPLLSYRAEGRPSMQIVIAVPPVGSPHTYADIDLDLGNPLQDALGVIVHVGELLNGKETNHLDLRKPLAKGKAVDFLYYTIV